MGKRVAKTEAGATAAAASAPAKRLRQKPDAATAVTAAVADEYAVGDWVSMPFMRRQMLRQQKVRHGCMWWFVSFLSGGT